MIKKIIRWVVRLWRHFRHHTLYVIADPADNSITLSRGLFRHMDVMKLDVAKVYVFKLSQTGDTATTYAFALNPPVGQSTQMSDIQYNARHRTCGFESLCPTVNRIFYDYGLPPCAKVKLSVEPRSVNNITYYTILRPCLHY